MTELSVKNVKDTVAWYRDTFEAKVEIEESGFALVQFPQGGRVAFKKSNVEVSGFSLHLQVENLDEEVNRFAGIGQVPHGEIKISDEGYRRAVFFDPNAVKIVLFEWTTNLSRGAAMTPPDWPAGECVTEANPSPEMRAGLIAELEAFPAKLTAAVATLNDSQLERIYRKWSIRQIVHHLADSHINCFVRLKLTLTESNPTIKPYDETEWTKLADNQTMPIAPSLAILTAVHARMIVILKSMTVEQFSRTYYHPEYKKTVTLNEMLGVYSHHGRHHLAQIEWVKANRAA